MVHPDGTRIPAPLEEEFLDLIKAIPWKSCQETDERLKRQARREVTAGPIYLDLYNYDFSGNVLPGRPDRGSLMRLEIGPEANFLRIDTVTPSANEPFIRQVAYRLADGQRIEIGKPIKLRHYWAKHLTRGLLETVNAPAKIDAIATARAFIVQIGSPDGDKRFVRPKLIL